MPGNIFTGRESDADIHDYTKRSHERSQPAKDPLQPLDISEDPWKNIGMDYFNGVCNYFSKFPFMLKAEISLWSLRDHLIDLFAVEGHLDDIVDNGDNDPYLKV